MVGYDVNGLHVEIGETDVTRRMEEKLAEFDRHGLSFQGWHARTAIWSDGVREYVIYDSSNKPRFTCTDWYTFDFEMFRIKMMLKESLDLRTIAETGEIPKVGY